MVALEAVAAAMARRDRLDSSRQASPLPPPTAVAADAIVVDSTGKAATDVLEEVLTCL